MNGWWLSRLRLLRRRQCLSLHGYRSNNNSRFLSYQYEPLPDNGIRLLELLPGDETDPLRCRIRCATLGGKTSYESLSYCWGTNRVVAEIETTSSSIPLTKNLQSALQHLRSKTVLQPLWIDAISINQADVDERDGQVAAMKDIFQSSDRTIVWLGPAGHDSGLAMDMIRRLADATQRPGPRSFSSLTCSTIPPLYNPAWSALAKLLDRPWFHRAWIVQEASVTKQLHLVCGNDTVSWDDLVRAVQYAVDVGVFIAYGGGTTDQVLKLFQTRRDFQNNRLPSLQEILLRNRSFDATDARDKVYGLLSLADQKYVRAIGIRPNYRLSRDQLYKKITCALLQREDLEAFNASGGVRNLIKSTLPSWISDWSILDSTAPLTSRESHDHGDHTTYTAHLPPKFSASRFSVSTPVFDHQKDLLGLEGILIDQLETVGVLSRTRYLRHVSHMFQLFVQCHDVLEQLKDWENVGRAGSSGKYLTGETHRDAYWHTLCAGRVPPGLDSARKDSRYKYYLMIRSLRRFVRLTIRWFPRSERDTWYNRLFYTMFQTAWRVFGLTPTKIQRIGFPPESRLSNHRRMARTKKGYVALAPRFAKHGDWIGIFKGGKLPLVLRKEDEHWTLVGESYVHGIMKGESWEEEKCERVWFK